MPRHAYGVLLVSFSRHSHQQSFVPLYQHHPRTRIIAVSDDPDIEPELKALNQEWAQKLKVPYIEGVDRALSRNDVDIVSIGHEIERRKDLVLRAAAADKHLWIDKFIGATVEECDAVVRGVEAAGVKSIIPSYVYGELVERSIELISSGYLGTLLGVHADVMFSKGIPRPIRDEDRQTPFLPPGQWKFPDIKRELLTVGAYAVGLVQCCLGPITHVYGQGDAYFFPEHAAHGAEDFGTLTMTDNQGAVASISGSRIGMGTHGTGGPSGAYLIGTAGTARVDGKQPMADVYIREQILNADYSLADNDPMQWASGPPTLGIGLNMDPLANGLEDLIEALDNDRMPRYTVREARDHMEILIAGYRSIVDESTVSLPLTREVTT